MRRLLSLSLIGSVALTTVAFAGGPAYAGAPSAAAVAAADPHDHEYGFQGEGPARIADKDARSGFLSPNSAQQAAVRALGASASWNAFGTPAGGETPTPSR